MTEQPSTPQLLAQLLDAPRVPLTELDTGLVLAQGTAHAAQPLEAPVTGQAVVGFQILYDLELRDGQRRQLNLGQIGEFELRSANGQARVLTGNGATLVLGHEYSSSTDAVGSAAAPVTALLMRHMGHDAWRAAQLTGNFTWHAYYVQQGEPVLVCGEVTRVLDNVHGRATHYRDNAYAPALRRPDGGALLISDLSHNELIQRLRR